MPQKMFRLTDEQICKLKKVSELRGCSQTDLIRGFIDSLDEEPPDTQGDTHRDTQEIHGDERSSGADSPALAARAEQHRKDLLDCWGAHIDEETLQEGRRDHTAYQWCDLGFVPIAEARWRLTRYGGNSAWYYCSPWDVRYDPDRAKELLETGPREYDRLPDGRPYDGRPWWQA